MADLWRKEGEQFFTDAGAVLNGGVLRYFDAGTSNTRTVYQDSGEVTPHGVSVTLDSSGRLTEAIYITTGAFKETLEDSAATQIFENDNIPGAVDLSSFVTVSVWETPVLSKTANYTVIAGDEGKVIQCNPTGGGFEITLPDAATVGDDFRISVVHLGTANYVALKPDTGELINGEAGQVLTFYGQTANLVCDGTGWIIDNPFGIQLTQKIPVVDRDLTVPPGSPTPGAFYLLPASGTLTGGWASFSNNDLVQANGQGGWIDHTPGSDDEGLVVDLLDEDIVLRWDGSRWAGSGSSLVSVQTFTATGASTWTKPDGVSRILVQIVGAGGGGGGATESSGAGAGAGGGGGGFSQKFIDVRAITSETVTIGAGGAGGSNGTDDGDAGGTTSFGAHCSVTGGSGGGAGSGSTNDTGGDGGQGSSGDINLRGQSGFPSASDWSGKGGDSFFGGGANHLTSSGDGLDGFANSGGGGSGGLESLSGSETGGDGADGFCIVYEYS